MSLGTLLGIGMGPGDPELVTLRAVSALGRADVVFAAASTKNEYSVSLNIARPYLSPDAEVRRLDFPMTRSRQELEAAWSENADTVAEVLTAGRTAGFLTLGDPLLYSTFGYLMRTLQRRLPDAPIEVVPGITSFQAAAARTKTIMAEAGENLVICSGVDGSGSVNGLVAKADNAVILKTYKRFGDIRDSLRTMNLTGRALFASRIGLDGERLERDIDAVQDRPHYLSLVLLPKQRDEEAG
jgi:precorrin-2/cobalt-factor-2 C20-methyltransferase